VDRAHGRAIGEALGVVAKPRVPELHRIAGVPRAWVRGY
jgi:hypothetical protein